jgi:hypothetical protein
LIFYLLKEELDIDWIPILTVGAVLAVLTLILAVLFILDRSHMYTAISELRGDIADLRERMARVETLLLDKFNISHTGGS